MAFQITPKKARKEVEILLTLSIDPALQPLTMGRADWIFAQAKAEIEKIYRGITVDEAALDASVAELQARVAALKAEKIVVDLT